MSELRVSVSLSIITSRLWKSHFLWVWILRLNLIHAFILISIMTHILAWLHLLNIIYSTTWNKANPCVAAATKKPVRCEQAERSLTHCHRLLRHGQDTQSSETCQWRVEASSGKKTTVSIMLVQSDKTEVRNARPSAERVRAGSRCRSCLLHLTTWQKLDHLRLVITFSLSILWAGLCVRNQETRRPKLRNKDTAKIHCRHTYYQWITDR